MPKLQRAKTVACGLLRWDRCCIIVVSHWSKPAGQNMASLLVVVGFRTSHSMPKEESHVIFSKNLPLKGGEIPVAMHRLSVETLTLSFSPDQHILTGLDAYTNTQRWERQTLVSPLVDQEAAMICTEPFDEHGIGMDSADPVRYIYSEETGLLLMELGR